MALEDVIKELEGLILNKGAVEELRKNFDGKEATDKTGRSLSLLATYRGLIQAQNNRHGLQYRVVKDLAADPEELRKIIKVSLPHINPVKKLK
jgi:hypothetical protein